MGVGWREGVVRARNGVRGLDTSQEEGRIAFGVKAVQSRYQD